MTSEKQRTFVSDLILSVCTKIINTDIPTEWDGFELRQYIADQFAAQVCDMNKTRSREYLNTVITRNP